MCGFLGALQAEPFSEKQIDFFRSRAARLKHRGNSSYGEHIQSGLAFFHHRLAFRDLKEGKQPLFSPDKKQVILFNGELYGFQALRQSLAPHYAFQSKSDTEVILASYLRSPSEFLHSLDGEYAFAIWDFSEKKLTLARDPFGVKPLFFASTGLAQLPRDFFRTYQKKYEFRLTGEISFASEMKGLPIKYGWNRESLRRQLCGLYEEMQTCFENIIQIPPGSSLVAKQVNGEWHCVLERKISRERRHSNEKKSFNFWDSAKDLRSILQVNAKNKLEADVPLGVYLSGGIDSRIAAFEMGKTGAKLSSFTVGFENPDYDESAEVKKFVAAYPNIQPSILKTNEESLTYSYEHAIYSSELVQPYTNGCAKWWLSRFARRHVRGVLTGDGADEIFCGYPSYRYLAWWQFYQKNPSPARAALYAGKVGARGEKIWEKGLSSREDGADLILSSKTFAWAHPLFAQIDSMTQLAQGAAGKNWLQEIQPSLYSYIQNWQGESPLTQWQNYFLHTHFPTHVLNWVGDRMEMANTLEGRPLYLSNSVLDFLAQLPDAALVRGMRDKAILRAAYKDELKHFSRTPKKQFNAPFLQNKKLWEKYLSSAALSKTNIFTPSQRDQAKTQSESASDPMQRSYAQMFLQNMLVTQMLDHFFVQDSPPERNLAWEENYLDEHSEIIEKA